MKKSEGHGPSEAAGVRRHELASLQPADVSIGGDERYRGAAEHILVLQNLKKECSEGVYALQQIQFPCEKAGLNVSTGVLQAHNPIAQAIAAFPENLVLSAATTFGSDEFMLEREALLSEADKLKDKLSSSQGNESTAKLAVLCQTYDENKSLLKEKLWNSEGRKDELHA